MTALHALVVEVTSALATVETAPPADRARIVEAMATARRGLDAIGALVGAPAAAQVVLTGADVRQAATGGGACARCGEKVAKVPSAGFGTGIRQICGACGYDEAA